MRDTTSNLHVLARYLCPKCKAVWATPSPCPADGHELVRDRTGELLAHRYRLRRPLGRGAMGLIWEAEQVGLHRKVAVKLVPFSDEESQIRFRRGASVMARMNHPNIAVLHDSGETHGPDGVELYLVMERLEGAPLSRFLRRGPLPFSQARSAGLQVLSALEHVHRRGYLHRDVKPANLFVTALDDDGFVVKLIDFGIARHADRDHVQAPPDAIIHFERARAIRVTQPLKILGTPEYMAPEQILGNALDPRADLYAVGVVLFHLLVGHLPFTGERFELYAAHLRNAPPDFCDAFAAAHGELARGLDDGALSAWRAFFAKALAKSAEDRFASALDMRLTLAALPPLPTPRER